MDVSSYLAQVQICNLFPFVEAPFMKYRHFVPPKVVIAPMGPFPMSEIPAVRVQF